VDGEEEELATMAAQQITPSARSSSLIQVGKPRLP
jgi:hypothetical protein